MRALYIIFFLLVSINVCSQSSTKSKLTSGLHVGWEIIENNYKGKREFLCAFTLTNKSKTELPAAGWSLYFNFPRMVHPASVTGNMRILHINGDFYRLFPSGSFKGLKPNDTVRIEFTGNAWLVSRADAPAGVYMVWDDEPAKGTVISNYIVRPSSTMKQYQRYEGDLFKPFTPAMVYENNKNIQNMGEDELTKVFPTPVNYKAGNGFFQLRSNGIGVAIDEGSGLENEMQLLSQELGSLFEKSKSPPSRSIVLVKNNLKGEAYSLKVNEGGIHISAGTSAGIFYGIQSLKTLIPPTAWKGKQQSINIPYVEIIDSPRFMHRAFMLDVARNFHSVDQVKKVIDVMALYKLNIFHFHFNDDEGWRIEIPGLPELTEVSGRRGHTTDDKEFLHPSFGSGPEMNSYGTGWYSRQDFIEILKYAKARHIKVIPEIETPGHARAAIAAMTARYERFMKEGKKQEAEKYMLYDPLDTSKYRSVQRWYRNVINPALPSTYTFLEHVVDELLKMYREAGHTLETIHFGGDEVPGGVWTGSPVVKHLMQKNPEVKTVNDLWYYYFGKITGMMKSRGMYVYGWEEAGMRKTQLDGRTVYIPNPDFANSGMMLDVWNNVIGWGAEDLPYQLANAGYKVVLSPASNMYFDLAYHKEFEEAGYYWAGYLDVDKPFYFIPFDYYKNSTEDINGNKISRSFFANKERLTDYGKQNIVGIQGLLWSETLRSPQQLEYLLLPKLLALSERAWSKDPLWAREKDSIKSKQLYDTAWSAFVNVLGKRELPRLDYYGSGYQYRIPTPGAIVVNGVVQVNNQFPGMVVRYTTNGKDPDAKSRIYTGPVAEKGTIRLRVFDSRSRGGRIVEVINP